MNALTKLTLAAAIALSPVSLAFAQNADHGAHHPAASPVAQNAADSATTTSAPASGAEASMTEGEVRKVDKDAGKVTIKHGPLKNLDMPAMTMVFRVKDPAMLDQVKAGDKVRFVAEKAGGAFTLVQLENVK